MALDVHLLRSSFDLALGRHADCGLTPKMYDWVGESLIATLAKVSGDQWTAAHTADWQQVFGAIAGMMLDGYPKATVASATSTD